MKGVEKYLFRDMHGISNTQADEESPEWKDHNMAMNQYLYFK